MRRVASALFEAASVPLPASGTSTISTWLFPNICVVIGSRIAPWVAATSPCSAATAAATRGPPRSVPVSTTSAGSGPPGKACWMLSRARTTGTLAGSSWMPGSSRCRDSTGTARASSRTAATPPQASGRRTTARASRPQNFDSRAAVRRRPSHGIRPRSVQVPSSDNIAGRKVSEPSTATPTTRIVPTATPENTSMPVRNNPARAIITVSPEITMARPEVPAAMRSASFVSCPAARSSRVRRR